MSSTQNAISSFSSTQTIAYKIHPFSQDSMHFSTKKTHFNRIKSKKITLNKDAGETHRQRRVSNQKKTLSDNRLSMVWTRRLKCKEAFPFPQNGTTTFPTVSLVELRSPLDINTSDEKALNEIKSRKTTYHQHS